MVKFTGSARYPESRLACFDQGLAYVGHLTTRRTSVVVMQGSQDWAKRKRPRPRSGADGRTSGLNVQADGEQANDTDEGANDARG